MVVILLIQYFDFGLRFGALELELELGWGWNYSACWDDYGMVSMAGSNEPGWQFICTFGCMVPYESFVIIAWALYLSNPNY